MASTSTSESMILKRVAQIPLVSSPYHYATDANQENMNSRRELEPYLYLFIYHASK